jgi:hypothetical protein
VAEWQTRRFEKPVLIGASSTLACSTKTTPTYPNWQRNPPQDRSSGGSNPLVGTINTGEQDEDVVAER